MESNMEHAMETAIVYIWVIWGIYRGYMGLYGGLCRDNG